MHHSVCCVLPYSKEWLFCLKFRMTALREIFPAAILPAHEPSFSFKKETFLQKMLCHLRPGHCREPAFWQRTYQVTCLCILQYKNTHTGLEPEILEHNSNLYAQSQWALSMRIYWYFQLWPTEKEMPYGEFLESVFVLQRIHLRSWTAESASFTLKLRHEIIKWNKGSCLY